MKEYISFDCHKRYTLVEREEVDSRRTRHARIDHAPGAITAYLRKHCEPGSEVAVEATGNWYWIVEEIEAADDIPRLVHPRKAKLMMGMINKTDKLDVHGMNVLQRNQTLPTVWIPLGETRDLRELTRGRMFFSGRRTQWKNRITSTLSKYGRQVTDVSDVFGRKGRQLIQQQLPHLPRQARWMVELMLVQLDSVEEPIREQEKRIRALVKQTPAMTLLTTLPGIGDILATVIALEIGDVTRFASAERLASYAGTTPRVHASGGKVRYGHLRPDVNRYLKWAYVEAANSVVLNQERYPERHATQVYRHVKARRGWRPAIGAVARHLAEATYYVLSRQQAYRDPALSRSSQRGVSAKPS